MPAQQIGQSDDPNARVESVVASRPRCRRVMVAVDESHLSQKAIPHGVAIANALNVELILLRVLESRQRNGSPSDPVEWHLLREQARSHIEDLAQQQVDQVKHIETRVVEGRPADQICRWAREHQVDLTVLCTHDGGGANERDMGRTVRRIVDCAPSSVLLVPAGVEESRGVRYRRILVPLDGSSRAESALPIALCLAEAQGAELILVHAIPEPELTEIEPPEPEDVELRARVLRRNERVAQDYLGRISAHIDSKAVPVRTVVLRSGDARHLLMRAVVDQNADLIVLASHGHSGHMDVASGSVATHLISHTPIPLLLVRSHANASGGGGDSCASDTGSTPDSSHEVWHEWRG